MKINVFKVFSSGKVAKMPKLTLEANSPEEAWEQFTKSDKFSKKYQYQLIDEANVVSLFTGELVVAQILSN